MPVDADKFATIRDKGRYRIQSVDFETFLERRGVSVVLRPLKITSENQEWVFVKQKDNYEIEAVSTKRILIGEDMKVKYSLSLEEKPIESKTGTKTGTSWTFYTASPFNDQLYFVSHELRDSKKVKSYLVYVDCEGETTFEPDDRVQLDQNFHFLGKGENYLWRLIEVTPTCLPDGDSNGQYRIHTLNGIFIHSVPGQESLSIKNQREGSQHAWTIQDMGNGNVTLYNMGANKYLATKFVADAWQPVLSESAPLALVSTGSTQEEENEKAPWRIEAISEVFWSICIWRRTDRAGFRGREQLSLALKDDKVILKPWKKAYNQLWIIEPTNALVPENDEISPDFSLQVNKPYQFKANDVSYLIRVAWSTAANRYEVTVNNVFAPSEVELTMERTPGGQDGEVFIYSPFCGKRYLTSSGSQVTLGDVPYSWTIERAQNKASFLIRDTKTKLYIRSAGSNVPPLLKSQDAKDIWTFWNIVPF